MENYEMLMLMVTNAKPDNVQISGSVGVMEFPIGTGKSDNWITVACDMRLPQCVTVTIIVNANGEIVGGARFYEVTNFFGRGELVYGSAVDLDNTEAEDAIADVINYMDWYDEEIEKFQWGRGV